VDGRPVILIDSESSPQEQAITAFHELLHLAGITDEHVVEQMAQLCGKACPNIIHHLPR
jgi:Zn-dependent peptidase ImmA (M78 family)